MKQGTDPDRIHGQIQDLLAEFQGNLFQHQQGEQRRGQASWPEPTEEKSCQRGGIGSDQGISAATLLPYHFAPGAAEIP